jgi:hypothetical protein
MIFSQCARCSARRLASLRRVGEGVLCRSSRLRFAASRLAAPRRLTAALAPAAPSEDTLTSLHRSVPARPSEARTADLETRGLVRAGADSSRQAALFATPAGGAERRARASARAVGCESRRREEFFFASVCTLGSRPTHCHDSPMGRRARVSSEGAAAASAATKRRGAASRKATLQARAPEEDTHARLTGKNQSRARTEGITTKADG